MLTFARRLARPLTPALACAALLLVSNAAAVANTATPAWSGDYQTGDLSQWADVHSARPDAVTVAPALAGSSFARAARFTVNPGDHWDSPQTERAEVMASPAMTAATEGADQWYAWSALFPAGTSTQAGGWMSFTQWHQEANTCPPNVAFLITEGPAPRVRLGIRGGSFNRDTCAVGFINSYDLGPLTTGTWTDFAVHLKWSSDATKGLVEVRMGGKTVLAPTAVANLYQGQFAYLKQGIYRSAMDRTTTIYVAGTKRGDTEASVAPPSTSVAPAPAPAPAPTVEPVPTAPQPVGTAPAPAPETTSAPPVVAPVGTSGGLSQTCDLAKVNTQRGPDMLVVYNGKDGRTTSPANPWGFEAAVVGGRVVAVSSRQTGMAIPAGGVVVSGHGTAEEWLKANAPVGGVATTKAMRRAMSVCLGGAV